MSNSPHSSIPSTPKVSVAMITYNHERFVAQAIESVLMQQTDFPIELVIGEDCSTDGTRRIVEHYARLRPDVIRPLLHQRNLGMHGNFQAVLKHCRGEFVALLEGDDRWSDSLKLRRQAAVLVKNPQVALSCHAVRIIDAHNTVTRDIMEHHMPFVCRSDEHLLSQEEVMDSHVPWTCAVLLRRSAIDLEAIGCFGDAPAGDHVLFVMACSNGRKAHFDSRPMSDYRKHGGGITDVTYGNPDHLFRVAEMYALLADKAGHTEHPVFKKYVAANYFYASRGFTDRGQFVASLRALFRSACFATLPPRRWCQDYGKCLARVFWRCLIKRLMPRTVVA